MQSKYDRNNCHRVVGVHEGLCNECLDVSEKVTLLFGYKIWITGASAKVVATYLSNGPKPLILITSYLT